VAVLIYNPKNRPILESESRVQTTFSYPNQNQMELDEKLRRLAIAIRGLDEAITLYCRREGLL
jgi:hypothetical protein